MSPSAQLSNEEKRPGNIFFTPGTKTPRKVQWLDADLNASTHSLDERGLNPAAFQRLTQALERHRTSSATKVHHYPPQPEPAHSMDISDTGGGETRGVSSPRFPNTPLVSQVSLSSGPPTGATDYVPGNFIDSAERAGLPGVSEPHGNAQRQADWVVRSHTKRGIFRLARAKIMTMKKKNAAKGREGPSGESRVSSDAERDAEAEAGTPRLGSGGVLSVLLSLYGQETGLSSGASTPGTSPPHPWVHPPKDDPRHHKRDEPRHVPSNLASEVIPTPPTLSRRSSFERKEPRFSHLTPENVVLRRHKNSRMQSGAGVFGPLIASTGNLTGFAAPIQSQLQPDYKKPGYKLSRYSHKEKPRASRAWFHDDAMPFLPSGASTPTVQSAPPSPTHTEPTLIRQKWPGMLKDFPGVPSIRSFGERSEASTPARSVSPTPYREAYFDFKRTAEDDRRKEKTWKRKKAQVFITRHVAKIIERQEFIMKFARAMMMFGGPSHRLQAQVKSTGRVLDIELSCIYFPDVLLISFDDNSTSTSNVKFIRQGSSLDLQKLAKAYILYWKVIHDKLYVSDASAELDILMRRPQLYNWWKLILIGGMCSSTICSVSFGGSFIDSLIVFPLGALLIIIQLLSVRNELYSNVFEVTVSILFSFLAAALAASRRFCYSAVASSSVVLILPGFIVLNGALEIMSRNIVAGSVRLCYAVMYALFLGFGLAVGAKAFEEITDGPWYQRTPSKLWAFLTVPMYSLFLSLRNQAPYKGVHLPLLVGIACIGWVTNYFTSTKFVNQSDVSAAVGAFAVGIVANLYARLFNGNAFVVMITGILFQLPSGLGSGGLLNYVSLQTEGDALSYLSGFQTALKLISVAIGLTVGLGISLVLMHPIQSKRRAGGIFSL